MSKRRTTTKSALASPREKGARRDKVDLPALDPDAMPFGVTFVRRFSGGDIVECSHHRLFRVGDRCVWCHGEARFTDGFALAVKRYVRIDGEPVSQVSLF